jgi:hypothetical protein
VTATDPGGMTASQSFSLTIANTNRAPTVANAIPDQNATADLAFNFQFAANTFADADNELLTYAATLVGGGALPAWLSFDANTRTFSGTPTAGDVGTIQVRVSASDGQGGSVDDAFDLAVQ